MNRKKAGLKRIKNAKKTHSSSLLPCENYLFQYELGEAKIKPTEKFSIASFFNQVHKPRPNYT
jgi:hypothetical protein